MDERSQRIVAKGMGVTLAVVYLCLVISGIWKYVTTSDITNSTWEILFIVMIPVSIAWFARKDESLIIPKMLNGEQIPTELNHSAKKVRKNFYFWDSLGLAFAFLVLTIIGTFLIEKDWNYLLLFPQVSETINIIFLLSIEFVISFIVFYVISFVWEEINVRRYNQKIDVLEDNDE
jgi:hypothetical protein